MTSRRRLARGGLAAALLTVACSGAAPARGQSAAARSELQPDQANFTASPYLPGRLSAQSLWGCSFAVDRGTDAGQRFDDRTLLSFVEVEVGLLDQLSINAAAGYARIAERRDGGRRQVVEGPLDTQVALRWQALDEASAPLTLTFDAIVTFPTGDEDEAFSLGRVGYGVGLAVARRYGAAFAVASGQFIYTANVRTEADRGRDVPVGQVGLTLGLEVLRAERAGTHQFLHLMLEGAATWNDDGNAMAVPPTPGRSRGIDAYLVSPGLRYGLQTRGGLAVGISVGAPIGLSGEEDDWGVVGQVGLGW